jgi:hypothetical protein
MSATESEIHALNTLIRSLLPQQPQRHTLDSNNNTMKKNQKNSLVLPSMPYERDLATSLTDLNSSSLLPRTPPPTPMVSHNKSVQFFFSNISYIYLHEWYLNDMKEQLSTNGIIG